ncbi:hypothetical protein [Lyticum sinuosum]|uniref:Putive FtsL-like cell division protein n=1 Tax=Lyticum sinuosum TaxID=1332059 RepID=A0AAE5AHG3_9RICK|nr:hypothetical protein [Lyticum sinuosum]MDZ5761073.1 Putive FtsL-like cell division protein [Lyticum sinuosum]
MEVTNILERKRNNILFFFFLSSISIFFIVFLFSFKYESHKIAKQERILQNKIEERKKIIQLLEVEISHLSRPYRIKKICELELNLEKINKDKIHFYKIKLK